MWGLYLGREDGRANVEDVQKGVIWRASPTPPPKNGRDAQPYWKVVYESSQGYGPPEGGKLLDLYIYSRSPKTPALQQLQKSSKSASAGS